jgi:uncharacterized OsmC-like protein
MSDEKKTKVGLKLEENMIFKCDLGEMKVKDCYIDETHKEEVDMMGPNPSRMLGVAVLGCLSSSFIFCLKKKDFTLDNLKAEAEVTVARNDKGFWRVAKIDVNIDIEIDDPEARKRADQCRKMFEQYCLVTQAVREGIDVEVNLNY